MSPGLSIEVLGDDGRVAQLPERGRLVVGSDPARANLVVTGQGVAGVHCAIGRVKGGGWALRDLGSDFGTHVNGKRVESARLRADDVLLLGSRRLRVFDPAQPAPRAAPPTPRGEARRPASSRQPPTPRAASDPAPKLPGYALDRRLGRGAMGEVWLATQVSLARRVAIKLLSKAHEEDPEFVERFQAEARAAAALNHPNVVTVHDVGEHEGHHFLAMEFMAAGCLESRLAALGPVPWREALGILLDAARGLEYAESRGIVHRDIKPANLMQTEDGITKICDLGLAVQLESEEVEAGGRRVFGTPHFIAPEVVRGGRADARSDLYSLGATAYRILSGHTPFEGENARAILRGVLHDEPTPLDERVPGLPSGVARLVERLLEKDPERRLPSASILVRELESLRASDGRPAEVAAGSGATSWKPTALAAGAVALLAVAAFAIFGRGDEPEPQPTPPPTPGPTRAEGAGGSAPVEDPPPRPVDDVVEEVAENDAAVVPDEATQPAEGEEAERRQERLALDAYLALNELQLTPEERLARLMKIATDFAGTDTARAVQADADELRRSLTEEIAAERARAARLAAYESALREAANLALEPPRPGIGLRGLRAVTGFEDLTGDAEAAELKRRVQDELLARSLEWANGRRTAASASLDAGDFDAFVDALDDLVAAADLPTFERGDPPAVTQLRELAREASERLGRLDELRSAWRLDRARRDRALAAEAVRAGRGLEAELAALDLSSAARRLGDLEGAIVTDEIRLRISALRRHVESAATAIESLVAAWPNDGWKRRTIRDPRPDGDNVEVADAGAAGLVLEDGTRLPWSAFGGAVDELDNLFHRRLERDWTSEEFVAIADLLVLQAVVATAAEATSELSGPEPGRFSQGAAERLLVPYDLALQWAREAGATGFAKDERRAGRLLADVLHARGEGLWAVAAEHLERLLGEEAGRALAILLSDGSDWVEPPPPTEEPEEATPPEETQETEPAAGGDENGGVDGAGDGESR